MKYKKFVSVLVVFLFFFGCDNQQSELPQVYNGLTRTDENGIVLSVDAEDWNYDDYLKVTFDTLQNGKIVPDMNVVLPPFPNPVIDTLNIQFGLADTARYEITILSRYAKEVKMFQRKSPIPPGLYSIKWNLRDGMGSRLEPEVYRIFFIYKKDEMDVFQCYGDIQIQ